eukprot:TRINITY_DN2730_c0_g1_i1.p1 TRINITY_DN2730_c0_g1~~TRINITY_DN2730_c0_g1_i1.p1  ORF type:complete len:364 (-),score=79.18 TRINITY_DN2730_c0_g1_i1:171-1262(-)
MDRYGDLAHYGYTPRLSPYVSIHQDLWWFCTLLVQIYLCLTLIDWILSLPLLTLFYPWRRTSLTTTSQPSSIYDILTSSSSHATTSTTTLTTTGFERTEVFPRHVAIIMDGNRRWATQRGLPKVLGHKAGVDALELIIKSAHEVGLEHLTVYAFSTENWKRPKDEVDSLLDLLRDYLRRRKAVANSNRDNIRINFIGDPYAMPLDIQREMDDVKEKTRSKTGTTVHIAFNYGGRFPFTTHTHHHHNNTHHHHNTHHTQHTTHNGRDEILRAIQRFGVEVAAGRADPKQKLSEKDFVAYLDTSDVPDPDLLIRTSSEKRLSNFLLWELAYSEFAFCDKLWPDFTKADLLRHLQEFQTRHRRQGA